MILYVENPKDATNKLKGLINEFSKVSGYRISIWKMNYRYETGSVGNIDNNYVISLMSYSNDLLGWLSWTVNKYLITLLCYRDKHNIIGQLHFKDKWAKLIKKKKKDLWLT